MKIYGYIKELVELWLKKDSQDVKITPNSNTYVGTTTFSLPPKTSGSTTLVDVDGSQTLTNKTLGSGTSISAGTLTGVTIDADLNTISNIENADIKAGAAIDATKLADGSVSNTELQYINSLSSNAQTQLDAKQPLDSDLTAIAGLSSSGLVARTGSGTAAARTITGTANKITVTDGDGVSGNPTLNIGTDVVTLTDTQSLSNKTLTAPTIDDAATFNHETTPANPAAGKVKLYPKSDNNFYTLDSAGVETQIGSGSGSGSGTLNIVDNPSATSATTGWTAATNYSVSRNTTDSPLEGIIDTCFAISTTTASSESSTSGVYAASLAMPVALRNTKVQVSLYLTTPASTDGVWRLSVYNASATRMTLSSDSSSVTTLPASFNGQFVCTFDADSSATYTVSLTQTTRTNANTLYYTNISIGNGITAQGAAISEWQSWTPTVNNAGSKTFTNTGSWRRVGSVMEMKFKLNGNTVAAGAGANTFQVNMPTGYTVASGYTYPTLLGNAETYGLLASGQFDRTVAVVAESTSILAFIKPATNGYYTTSDLNVAYATEFYAHVSVPIAEWSGSGTVNLGPGAQVEYAYNTDTSGTADPSGNGAVASSVSGPTGIAFSSSWAVGTQYTRRVRFQYPIQSDDILQVEVKVNGVWAPAEKVLYGTYRQTSLTYGIRMIPVSGSTTDVDINFTEGGYASTVSYGANGAAWSGLNASYMWRVRKAKASSPVGFGLAGTGGSSGLVNPYTEGSGVVYANTYTPTLTRASGVTCSFGTAYGMYQRVGKIVTITGQCTINNTSGGDGLLVFTFTLPIASTLTSTTIFGVATNSANSDLIPYAGTALQNSNNGEVRILTKNGGDNPVKWVVQYVIA